MRSRYTANVLGRWNHLWATWHPLTRPPAVGPSGLTWTGLEIVRTRNGGPGDDSGVVEFRAHYRSAGRSGVLREVSRFRRRAGRWLYVDGDVD